MRRPGANLENTESLDGRRFYVVDAKTDERVMGPYGTPSYANLCASRFQEKWNNPLITAVEDVE